jgi:hypothetical protein
VTVRGGAFSDVDYKPVNPNSSVRSTGNSTVTETAWGAEMTLQFLPNKDGNQFTEIHLVQTVKDIVRDVHAYSALHQGNVGFSLLRPNVGDVGIDVEFFGKNDDHYRKVREAR